MEIIFGFIMIFLIWIWPIIIAYQTAKKKNRNYRLWTFFAFFFGWIVAILSLLVTKKDQVIKY